MVMSRIEIELAAHGGNDNGRLPVTTEQFVEYGMHRTSVAPAIREAEAFVANPFQSRNGRIANVGRIFFCRTTNGGIVAPQINQILSVVAGRSGGTRTPNPRFWSSATAITSRTNS
jgi:hypothetical protein